MPFHCTVDQAPDSLNGYGRRRGRVYKVKDWTLVVSESRQDIQEMPQDRFVLSIDYQPLRHLTRSITVTARKPTTILIPVRRSMLVQGIEEDCAGAIAHWARNHHITALPRFKRNTTFCTAFHVFCAIRATVWTDSCPMGEVLVGRSRQTALAILRISTPGRNRITLCHHRTSENIFHPLNALWHDACAEVGKLWNSELLAS